MLEFDLTDNTDDVLHVCNIYFQIKWRLEIGEALEKIHSEGSHLTQNEEELVKRRLQELR